MKVWQRTSLQWRLTLSVLLVTGVIWTAVLVVTWFKTAHELSELLDAHLAQTAAVLAAHTGDGHDDDFTTAAVLHKYQPRVAFQIWHDKTLISRSAEAPSEPLAPWGQSGVLDRQLAGQSWRVFATPGRDDDVWVVVAELQSARRDILDAGLQSAIVPMVLALPILVLLMGGVIFQSLTQLRQLSESVSRRQADDRQTLSEDVSAEVLPLVQALNRLFDQMALHMEGERRFTADAAHELRTPIAAIRMQAQVALGAVSEAERQSALTAVLQACDRATRLVAQLLQLARLDADGDLLGAGHCDAAVETRAILADLGPQLLAKRQEINLDAPDTLPLPMPPGLVGVLVGNLVDNAGRYSPVGARIHVQWQGLPRPQLLVQDSGPGMSEADVARLGHRFFRVPGSGADGSGLGWSIVRRLCQRYGLAVQLSQSPDGGGLQVRVTWPALVD